MGSINKRALDLIKEKEEEHTLVHRKALDALDKKEQERSAMRVSLDQLREEFDVFRQNAKEEAGGISILRELNERLESDLQSKLEELQATVGNLHEKEAELSDLRSNGVDQTRTVSRTEAELVRCKGDLDRLRGVLEGRTHQDLFLNKKQVGNRSVVYFLACTKFWHPVCRSFNLGVV